MSRARDLADLGGSANAGTVTGSNLVINGDMTVNQRGDTTGASTSGYYSVDRYRMLINSLGAYNISQSDNVPDGFAYAKRWYCSTADASPAAGDYFIVEHRLEGQDLQHLDWGSSSAKKVTLSFWVKSNLTGTYVVELTHHNSSIPYNSLQYTIDTADTWEYKTLTFSGDTGSSTPNDNGIGLYINWWISAGTDFTGGTYNADTWHITAANRAAGLNVNMASAVGNNWNITGVKLEVGSTATPFQHESYAENLAKCQRYYCKSYDQENSAGSTVQKGAIFDRYATTVSNRGVSVQFPVTMRYSPTVTLYSLNGTSGSVSNCGTGYTHVSDDSATINGTIGETGFSKLTNISSANMVAFHYTAEAEL